MAIPFLSDIDLNKNQALQLVLHNSTSDPSGGVEGQVYYNTDDNKLMAHNGTAFANVGNTDNEVKALTGAMVTGNTETGITVTYESSDRTLDFEINAAQTTITSILNSSLVVGRDGHNQIDFSTDNQIKFKTNNETPVIIMKASGEIEATKFDGALEGNADTATALATGRTIAMTGDVNWTSASFDGSGNVTGTSAIQADAVHATMVNDDIISAQTELTSGNAVDADEMLISDGGTIKKIGLDSLKTYFDTDVSVANLKTRLAGGFGSNAVTIGDSDDVVTIGNDLIITGDLTVSGDTITANVGTLDVEDKNITVNKGSGDTSSTASGAGLTIQDAVDASTDATMLWDASNDEFDFSHAINITGKISTSGTIELGHATDTTISRSAAGGGDIDIEGNIVYRAGGTDVAIADGGTGASTAAAAFTNLKQAATTSATGVVELATTTEASTGTDSSRAITSDGLQQFHNDRNKSFELDNSASGVASSDNITYTITHGMGASRLYKVEIIEDSSNYQTVHADVKRPSDTTITVAFASAVIAGTYRALITKI
tara:strand:+ start:7740 stop:9380 length:1641 start_codon:yes stop_codon:yes gene_type:complete